jgi:hypothetical protein
MPEYCHRKFTGTLPNSGLPISFLITPLTLALSPDRPRPECALPRSQARVEAEGNVSNRPVAEEKTRIAYKTYLVGDSLHPKDGLCPVPDFFQ